MVGPMATTSDLRRDLQVPAAERPACWWALLVGAPPGA
jgi:hypothetical protein